MLLFLYYFSLKIFSFYNFCYILTICHLLLIIILSSIVDKAGIESSPSRFFEGVLVFMDGGLLCVCEGIIIGFLIESIGLLWCLCKEVLWSVVFGYFIYGGGY